MSFFRYPGGKRKLRKHIITRVRTMMRQFSCLEYREPFLGGGSIMAGLLKAPLFERVWLNDKDIGVACIWTALLSHSRKLKKKLKNYIPKVDDFYEFRDELLAVTRKPTTEKGVLDMAFKKIVTHQISYSGLGVRSGGPLGGREQRSKYKIDCRWSPDYICKRIDTIAECFSDLVVVKDQCTCSDFEPLLNIGGRGVVVYLDPPYYVKGNDLYQFGFTVEDHERLANVLRGTKHKWLLSYDDCPEIRSLYSDWARLDEVDVTYNITAMKEPETGIRKSRSRTELLISSCQSRR